MKRIGKKGNKMPTKRIECNRERTMCGREMQNPNSIIDVNAINNINHIRMTNKTSECERADERTTERTKSNKWHSVCKVRLNWKRIRCSRQRRRKRVRERESDRKKCGTNSNVDGCRCFCVFRSFCSSRVLFLHNENKFNHFRTQNISMNGKMVVRLRRRERRINYVRHIVITLLSIAFKLRGKKLHRFCHRRRWNFSFRINDGFLTSSAFAATVVVISVVIRDNPKTYKGIVQSLADTTTFRRYFDVAENLICSFRSRTFNQIQ